MAKILSNHQIKAIDQLIKDTHLAFMIDLGGESAIPAEDLRRLRASGKLRNTQPSLIQRAYEYGLLSGTKGPDQDASISVGAFMAFLNSSAAQLSAKDRRAVDSVTEHMVAHVNGMALDLQRKFSKTLADADLHMRRLQDMAIAKITSEGAAKRESVKEVATRLRNATKDLRRNWTMVAATEMGNWIQEGKASAIQAKSGSRDPLVFKRPRPTACVYCKLLYLEPDGITPRVFQLSDLAANGTNHERKPRAPTLQGDEATEWRPTLGAVHPFCQCSLGELPEGYGFDKQGNLEWRGLNKSVEVSPFDRLLADHECV